jgi:hypothetical protein
VIFSLVGLLIGGWQFKVFPWKKKPTRPIYILTLLIYLSVCTGFGYLSGGWLAGQFGRIIAAN